MSKLQKICLFLRTICNPPAVYTGAAAAFAARRALFAPAGGRYRQTLAEARKLPPHFRPALGGEIISYLP